MPSRLITAGILLFWLAMTGWLIEREVVPMMIADASPTYQIDLTDEISSPLIGWNVLSNGKRLGSATSEIKAHKDRSFEFRSKITFDKLHGLVGLRMVESVFRVTEDSKLVFISERLSLSTQVGQHPDLMLEMRGDVVDGILHPRFFQNGAEWKLGLSELDFKQQGDIVNPMHAMSRLRGLRAGQTWKISKMDLWSLVQSQFANQLGKKGLKFTTLIAEVKVDVLHWSRKDVLCHKIEYYEPGKEVTARTWVRKADGLVLQQEASHDGVNMIMQRVP